MQAAKSTVILEWAFSPPDYFAAPIRLKRDTYVIALADGKVEVRIDAALYDLEPTLREQLHETVNTWFADAQRASGRPYRLSEPTELRVYYDATRGASQAPTPNLSSTPPTLSAAGAHGASDSPRAGIAGAHRIEDPLLRSLLQTYDAAVADPEHELVRLGAIREALSAALGDAPAALGIDAREWARLGELTAGAERNADDGLRAQARAIALRTILAYLRRAGGDAPTLSAG